MTKLTEIIITFQRPVANTRPRKTLTIVRQHETTGPYANREVKIRFNRPIEKGINRVVKETISRELRNCKSAEKMFYVVARFKRGQKHFHATIVPRTEIPV